MEHKTHSLAEFNAEARRFARELEPGAAARVVALSGELGAGKTTFTQTIAREFGVEDQVNSPTFVIEKIYECSTGPFVRLIHIDAYRLQNAHELEVLGWPEIVADKDNLILIEWPENVEELIPPEATRISLGGADDERTITYGEK
jgi:tRNA threonylcarbamoyladenosine biosynthesis protein TsaE